MIVVFVVPAVFFEVWGGRWEAEAMVGEVGRLENGAFVVAVVVIVVEVAAVDVGVILCCYFEG